MLPLTWKFCFRKACGMRLANMKLILEPSKNWQLNASNESSKIIPWVWKTHLRFIPSLSSSLLLLALHYIQPFWGTIFTGHYIVSTPHMNSKSECNIFLGCILCPPFLWLIFFHIITIWLFHILFISLSPPSPECELLHGGELVSLISVSTGLAYSRTQNLHGMNECDHVSSLICDEYLCK